MTISFQNKSLSQNISEFVNVKLYTAENLEAFSMYPKFTE